MLMFGIYCFCSIFFFASKEVRSQCTVSEDVSMEATNQLFYLGSKNVIIANNDDDVDKRCEQIDRNAKILKEQMDCAPEGTLKYVFGSHAKSYQSKGKDQCESSEYRKGYVKFSKCMSEGDTLNQFQQCGYKLSKAWTYCLENFPVEDQIPNACCAMTLLDGCVADKVSHCPSGTLQFFQLLFYSNAMAAVEYACRPGLSLADCKTRLPDVMEKAEEIFSSTEQLPTDMVSIYHPLYQLFTNVGENRPKVD